MLVRIKIKIGTILGKESANKEMTLTEIYNSEDVNTIKEKNRIGF